MKKALLSILFAFSTLALSAQGGIKVNYQGDRPTISEFARVSYDLPRTGKNITVNHWYDDGRKTQKTLKFDGRRFSF